MSLPIGPTLFERQQFINKWIQNVVDMSATPDHNKRGRDGEGKKIEAFGRPRPISREGNTRKGINPRSEGGFYEEQNSELSSNYYRNDSMLDSAYGSMGSVSVANNHNNAPEPTNRYGSSKSQQFLSSKSSWSSGFDSFKPDHYNLQPPDSTAINMRKPQPIIFGRRDKKDKEAKDRNFKLLLPLKEKTQEKLETQEKSYKTSPESKALQVAALSQALGYIDRFQKTQELKKDKSGKPDQSELNDLATNLHEASQGAVFSVPDGLKNPLASGINPQTKDQQVTEVLAKEYIRDTKSEEAFCAAVSLNDGLVMHTTISITEILGYPKDMWVGRSFIDFIHPQDRVTFTSQITEGIILPLSKHGTSNDKQEKKDRQSKGNGFFCRMRKYNGLKSGFFSVKERKTVYLPFKLSVCFRELSSKENATSSSELEESEPSAFGHQNTCLFITAVPMNSAYISPNEAGPISYRGQSSFITKHGPTCNFSLVEESSISFLGYLPQDLCGNDIFGYYHPQDLEVLKEAFEAVMLEHGKPFRSKPYRFKIRNGCYILLATDFSCFINPWSRKLEFIIGKHTVMKGPKSPDIFDDSEFSEAAEENGLISDEILKQSKNIQNEIRQLLTETVHRTVSCHDSLQNNSSRRRKQLASFMGYLLDKMANSENKKKESGTSSGGNNTLVLGDIAEDSSETPPSYNQLNYNENLTRFFNSQPKTLTEEEAIEEKEIEEKKIDESFSASTYSTNEGVKSNTRKQQQDDEKRDERKPVELYEEQSGSSASKNGTCSENNKQKRERKTQKEENKDDGGRSGSSSGNHRNTTNSGSADPSSSLPAGMSAGQNHQGRDDGMMSQDGTGSGDGSRLGSGSREGTSNVDDYKSPLLTEELLQVHDKGMEKKMIDMYKETRKMGELKFQRQRNLARNKALQAKARKNPFSKWHGVSSGRVQKSHNSIEKNIRNLMQRDERNPYSNNAYPQYRPMADTLHRTVGGSLPTSFNFSNINPGQSSGGFSNPQHKQLSMRSSPPGLTSFSNLISVPAFYFPTSAPGALSNMPTSNSFFDCNASRPSMMLQTGPAYIPINALPGFYPAYPAKDDMHQTKKDNQSSHHTQTPQSAQSIPDLPNSLAVKSCIADKHDSVKSDKSNQANLPKWVQKNGQHVKFMIPKIRDSERESVKAEPGSALESNASASASVKDKRIRSPACHSPDQKYGSQDKNGLSESSSSLYSLLKSSDEYTITESDFTDEQDKNSKSTAEKKNARPRPVLSEPFWNDNVVVNNDLLYNYQLEVKSLEDILKDDMESLSLLTQSSLVNEQLSMLYGEIDAKGEMADPLLYENCSIEDEDDDTETSDNSESGIAIKKKERYEVLNLIHGADAPFPMPDSPGHPQQRMAPSIMHDWSSASETQTDTKSTSSKGAENSTQMEPTKDSKETSR